MVEGFAAAARRRLGTQPPAESKSLIRLHRVKTNACPLTHTASFTATSNQCAMTLDNSQRDVILQHANRLLSARAYPKTICPSEIARALTPNDLETLNLSNWRDAMADVRQVMWERREAGEVEILQKGEVVYAQSLDDITGPIRIREVSN